MEAAARQALRTGAGEEAGGDAQDGGREARYQFREPDPQLRARAVPPGEGPAEQARDRRRGPRARRRSRSYDPRVPGVAQDRQDRRRRQRRIARMTVEGAAALIREGKLVAFPTETVYGLGANALDAVAVERIFTAKRRPHTSPLIVHVASIQMARDLAARWPETAETLARHYWPGPLTLVLPKREQIPDIVTAGLPTVGLRMP